MNAAQGTVGSDPVILATAGYDHTVRFWQAHSGICTRTVQHQDSQVNALEITPDRSMIAAAGYQHIRMYDLNSNNPNPVINYDGVSKNITSVGFHEDGRWMYTGGEDCMARIWDLRSRNLQCQRIFQVNAPINCVCLHPNQAELIVGDQSGAIHIWDLKTDHNEQLIPEPEVSVNSVHIDPDASYMAAVNSSVSPAGLGAGLAWPGHTACCVSAGQLLCVEPDGWHRRGGDTAHPQDQDPGAQSLRPAVQVQPRLHVSVEPSPPCQGTARPFQAARGQLCLQLCLQLWLQLCPSCGCCWLHTAGQVRRRGMWHHWDCCQGVPLSSLSSARFRSRDPSAAVGAPPWGLFSWNLSQTVQVLLATCSADQTCKIWRTSNFSLMTELSIKSNNPGETSRGWMWDCAFSGDSQYIVTASSDNLARLWCVETGEIKREYSGHQKAVVCLAFNDSVLG